MQSRVNTALTCLNEWSSFLAFEKLQGSESHVSDVYHTICRGYTFGLISVTRPELSPEINAERTANLLLELNANQFKCIQLLGHSFDNVPDENPARAFFVTYCDQEQGKKMLVSICRSFGTKAVAISHQDQIRIIDLEGRVLKMYRKATMEPCHLKRIWSAMSGQHLVWLESGVITVSPLMCLQVASNLGLRRDCAQLGRVKTCGLVRYRPLRPKEAIEAEITKDALVKAHILADAAVKAKQKDNIAFEQKLILLREHCSKYGLGAEAAYHEAVLQTARILAVDVENCRVRSSDRHQRKYEQLRDFCADHGLDINMYLTNQ